MKNKRTLLTFLILIWQIESVAAPMSCARAFAEKKTSLQKITDGDYINMIKELREIEMIEQELHDRTSNRLANAAFESANQAARELELAIGFNMWDQAKGFAQGPRARMQEVYNNLKREEPRFLELKKLDDEGHLTFGAQQELVDLQNKREEYLSYIGANLNAYERIMFVLTREVREGDTAKSTMTPEEVKRIEKTQSAYRAQAGGLAMSAFALESVVTPALGPVTPERQYAQGILAKDIIEATSWKSNNPLKNSRFLLDPTVEQLQAIAKGTDRNLLETEKLLPRRAKAIHDLDLQKNADEALAKIEAMLKNQETFEVLIERLIQIAPSNWPRLLGGGIRDFLSAVSTKQGNADGAPGKVLSIEEVRKALRDTRAIMNHYSGISKLMDVEMTPTQKYALFKELCARSGPPVDGVPPFLVTLVRRSDTADIVAQLKDYVKKEHPDEIMGKGMTMYDLIVKAEASRELGLLPSMFSPGQVMNARTKSAMISAAVSVVGAIAMTVLTHTLFKKDDDKNKKDADTAQPAAPVKIAPSAAAPAAAPAK